MAPAVAQFAASIVILAKMINGNVEVLQKTLMFRSFQTSQETNMIKEAKPFLQLPLSCTMLFHQLFTKAAPCQRLGWMCRSLSHVLIMFQIRIVNRHWNRRWGAVSSTCLLHRGQRPQFGQPRRSSLSVVHTLFWMINQAKNLHLGGVQFFQITLYMFVDAAPRNWAL